MQERVKARAIELLESGVRVLGWKAGEFFYDVTPAVFTSREEIEKEFVFGRHSMNERRKKQEIGIHAVRGGTVVGKHNVMFLGNDEIISISHEAQSKAVFTVGAVRAALFIADKAPGMYDMPDMIK